MSGVDPDQVRHVADLARLELSEEEVERLSEEMGRVLSRFAELESAERETEGDGGPAPGSRPGETAADGDDDAPLRPDRPDADRLAQEPAEIAPEWRDGFFLVPRLEALGGDGGSEAG